MSKNTTKNGNGKQPSLEQQMAVQMGWKKPNPADGTPVPLAEQLDKDALFPAARPAKLMDLEMLYESPHNPRKVFKDLEGLAASIQATNGLLQPIIARRRDNGPHEAYEIITGARRFRALQLLKFPALVEVRELTDAQMTEAMMAENDQRDGLLPLEQAHGYKNMLTAGFTVESAAEKLGVSTGTVRGRLALLNLGKRAGKMLLSGQLPGAVATKLAQFPEALQEEALEQMESEGYDHGLFPLSLEGTDVEEFSYLTRPTLRFLQERFTRSLKSTAFNQKEEGIQVPRELWPNDSLPEGFDELSAPACASCPRNSKYMSPELAGENAHDEKRFGFCTLPPCFTAKTEHAAVQIEAQAKAEGLKLLTTQQVWKELRDGRQNLPHSSSFLKLDAPLPQDPKHRSARQLLEQHGQPEKPTVHVALTEHAGRVDLVKEAEVLKQLAEGGVAWAKDAVKAKKATAARRTSSGPSKATQQKTAQLEAARSNVRATVYRKVVEKYRAQGLDLDAVRTLIDRNHLEDGPVALHELFGLGSVKEFAAWVEKKATMPDLLVALWAVIAQGDFAGSWRSGYDDEVARCAKICKLDLKKLEKHELEALQAAAKESENLERITWRPPTKRGDVVMIGKGKSGIEYSIEKFPSGSGYHLKYKGRGHNGGTASPDWGGDLEKVRGAAMKIELEQK